MLVGSHNTETMIPVDCWVGSCSPVDGDTEDKEDILFWARLHFARSHGLAKSWIRLIHCNNRLVSFPTWWMDGFEKKIIPEEPSWC